MKRILVMGTAVWLGWAAAALPSAANTPAARAESGAAVKSRRAAQELATAQKCIADITGEFALTVRGAGRDGGDMKARGRVWLASGRRYRVEYTEPEAQLLVSNGKQRWLYMKKINQVQIQELPPAGNPSELFLELGGGLPVLISRCLVRRLPDEAGARVYELTPRAGEDLQFQRARLHLTGDKLLPKRVDVDAARQVSVEFTDVSAHTRAEVEARPQTGLPASLFTFTPPEGAEVIEPLWPSQ